MSQDDKILDELVKIREALAPTPEPEPELKPKDKSIEGRMKGFVDEFKDFLAKYKVLGLAIAFIMGAYVGQVVQALVDDLIMPIVEFAMPSDLDWEQLMVGPFRIGHFIGTIITFLMVALVIFLIVKLAKRWGIET